MHIKKRKPRTEAYKANYRKQLVCIAINFYNAQAKLPLMYNKTSPQGVVLFYINTASCVPTDYSKTILKHTLSRCQKCKSADAPCILGKGSFILWERNNRNALCWFPIDCF